MEKVELLESKSGRKGNETAAKNEKISMGRSEMETREDRDAFSPSVRYVLMGWRYMAPSQLQESPSCVHTCFHTFNTLQYQVNAMCAYYFSFFRGGGF